MIQMKTLTAFLLFASLALSQHVAVSQFSPDQITYSHPLYMRSIDTTRELILGGLSPFWQVTTTTPIVTGTATPATTSALTWALPTLAAVPVSLVTVPCTQTTPTITAGSWVGVTVTCGVKTSTGAGVVQNTSIQLLFVNPGGSTVAAPTITPNPVVIVAGASTASFTLGF
jgi:hypothetical protein